MNKIISSIFIALISITSYASSLIHPHSFKGSDIEKKQLIKQIQQAAKAKSVLIGMNDPTTLRMMEKEELNAFKSLLKNSNKQLLDISIEQACGAGMCDYSSINMLYQQHVQSNSSELEW